MSGKINHAERAHAVLSASSASRWLNCTPSARMADEIEPVPEIELAMLLGYIEETTFAAEGTLAHEISENDLRYHLKLIDKTTYHSARLKLKAHELFHSDMLEPVEDYVNFVLEQVAEARTNSADPLILIEEKVSLEAYIPEGFGTGDFIAISGGILYVTDLKFGMGVRVSAVDNDQLKIYGLGAYDKYSILHDIHTIRLTVVQPRLDAISTWDISSTDLLDWAETFVKPQAEIAFSGRGEPVPGDWCRFCEAKIFCPALKDEMLRIADEDFASDSVELGDEDVHSLHFEDVMEIYKLVDRVKSYLNAVEEHIYNSALGGKKWPGLKLVAGRGRRSIPEAEKAMDALRKKNVPAILYKQTKLRGLTELQKGLGKKNMDAFLGPFITYAAGKPALVDESDRRPELNRGDDFDDDFDLLG